MKLLFLAVGSACLFLSSTAAAQSTVQRRMKKQSAEFKFHGHKLAER